MTSVRVSMDSFAQALGADDVARVFAAERFSVSRVGGIGLAWAEPLVEIETEHEGPVTFGPVDLQSARVLARRLSKTGSEIPSDLPNRLGRLSDVPYLANQHRLVFDRAGCGHPSELASFTVANDALSRDPEEIIRDIEISGLRGRGGAGFPAHIKWRTVRDTPANQKYVVCNADEGDSGTFADRILMESDPFKLIEGMVIAGYATGASKGYVYLRSEYPVARDTFSDALLRASALGYLGKDILGSGFAFDIELFIGAGAYICGEETSLLESLEGKRGEIRVKPPVPAIAGLFQKPTLVHNVISFASVPGILEIGAEAYRELGVEPSCGTMCFQLAGNVARGGLIEMPFGVTLRELVEDFGHGTHTGTPLRAVQLGGPLGAYLSREELDLPLTYESMASVGAGIGHGGIVVFDNSIDLAEQARYAFEFCEIESCGKCTPCRLGSARGRETMEQLIEGRGSSDTLELIEDLCEVMEKASLCQMGGMTPIPVRTAIERFPQDFTRLMRR